MIHVYLAHSAKSRYLKVIVTIVLVLLCDNIRAGNITISWKAPVDVGGLGRAYAYDVRYDTSRLTETSWNQAIQVANEPAPGQPGKTDSVVITGLIANTHYYFAMKSVDQAGNWSAMSNVVEKVTLITSQDDSLLTNKAMISFWCRVPGVDPAPDTILVTHSRLTNVPIAVTHKSSWISADSTDLLVPSLIVLRPVTALLVEGLYSDTIAISCTEAVNSPLLIPVSLLVSGTSVQGLAKTRAVPNPYHPKEGPLRFENVPIGVGVTLMTGLSGQIVRLWKNNTSTEIYWDGRNESGYEVASGVYLWFLNDGSQDGKIIVER